MKSSTNSYRRGHPSSALQPSSLIDGAGTSHHAYNTELTYSHERKRSSSGSPLEDYLFSYQNALINSHPLTNNFQSSNANPELASSDLTKYTTATHNVSQDRLPDFQSLSRKYLRMLANESDDNRSLNTIRTAPLAEPQAENYGGDPQSLEYDSLIASEFLTQECFTDYLSSPLDVSPIESSPSSSIFGSPIMKTIDSNNESGWVNTDNDIRDAHPQHMNSGASESAPNDTVPKSSVQVQERSQTSHNSASPPTSASGAESRNLYPTKRLPGFRPDNIMINTSACQAPSSFKIVNGTRHHLTLNELVPLDAPTRPRRSMIPSESSSPPTENQNQKRLHSLAFDDDGHNEGFNDEEDSLPSPESSLGPNATESEKLALKRRRCTLAARRSRRRKLEYQLMLERRVGNLEEQRDKWKTRCTVLQEILKRHNADFKFEEEEEEEC
ncbi:hypothetical protein C8R41DRAFT_834171 [Lentinula lateritia]|uniref:BZIP domain-containing protein n=1 Tax=Lentinula lateritia TaxID=40482 RepID=A0ABQ8VE80_9AGAR|nr:hypothetical protein C8R41DRAFT_834171 [Lentinula lateritia]